MYAEQETDPLLEVENDEGCSHENLHITFPTNIKTESPDDQIDIKPSEISPIKAEGNSPPMKSCIGDPLKCNFRTPCKSLPASFQSIKPFAPIVKEEVHHSSLPEVKVEFADETNDSNFRCSICSMSFVNQRIYSMHFNVSHRTAPSVSTQTNSGSSFNNTKPNVKRYSASTIKKLIESVRNNPCLYNTDNENFNNEDLKTLTWTTIADECNFPNGASAKAEWKNLLIRLINALTISGQGQTNRVQRTWQFKKQMEFVLPYITDDEIHTLRHANTDTTNYHKRHSQRIETLQSTKRKRQESVEASTSNADGGQPLDMFFLSMCATTKNLPSYVQLQVKKKIFNAVIEAEEIVAAMHNDQAKNSMFDATPGTHDDEYQNNLSPFSVQSNADEEWQDN